MIADTLLCASGLDPGETARPIISVAFFLSSQLKFQNYFLDFILVENVHFSHS